MENSIRSSGTPLEMLGNVGVRLIPNPRDWNSSLRKNHWRVVAEHQTRLGRCAPREGQGVDGKFRSNLGFVIIFLSQRAIILESNLPFLGKTIGILPQLDHNVCFFGGRGLILICTVGEICSILLSCTAKSEAYMQACQSCCAPIGHLSWPCLDSQPTRSSN
jgi:hypothetical protein